MMNEMNLIPVGSVGMGAGVAKPAAASATGDFGAVLRGAIESVSSSGLEADAMAAGLASGQHSNIHETMIAMEKAGISFHLMTKVQSKVVDAYKEIMRLQL